MFSDPQLRLTAFTRLLAVSVLGCLACSWSLWVSRPHYPLIPLFEFVPALPFPFDFALLGWLVVLLLGIVYQPRSRLLITLVLGTFGLLFLQDQSRLWPSFYQFSFLFLLLISNRRVDGLAGDERILASLRYVMAMAYFWGGMQKLNPHFFHEEFPWFVDPVIQLWPFATPLLPAIAVFAALFEIMIGLGLLTRRLRHAALGSAMLMNLLICFCIGPLRDNWNTSSWTWGMTVAVQTWVLFFRAPAFSFRTMFAAPPLHNISQGLAVLLIGFLPALNNVNYWDSALSFNVYSGNVDYAEIHIRPDVVDCLPDEIAALVHLRFGEAVLVPNEWSRREFNANAYPETRVFKAIFRAVCDYLPEGSATLYIQEKAGWFFPKSIDRYQLNGLRGVELTDAGIPPPGA